MTKDVNKYPVIQWQFIIFIH